MAPVEHGPGGHPSHAEPAVEAAPLPRHAAAPSGAPASRRSLVTVAVHVGQLLQPVPGGIGRYVRSLLPCLPAAGVAPVAFGAGPRPPGLDGVRYVDLGWPRGALRYEAWHRLGRPRVTVDGDVVHATS